MDPFEGFESIEPTPTTEELPGHVLASLHAATPPASLTVPAAPKERDGDDDFVIGLFNPKSFGATLREEKFSNAEIVRSLTNTIRTGLDKDKMAAIRLLTSLAKEALTLSGKLTTATMIQEQTDEKGATARLELSQTRLQKQMGSPLSTSFGEGEGVTIQPPLSQKEIQDANIIHPDHVQATQRSNLEKGSEPRSQKPLKDLGDESS